MSWRASGDAFDRQLAEFLGDRAESWAAGAATSSEMTGRVAARLIARRGANPRALQIAFAATLIVLATVALAVLFAGNQRRGISTNGAIVFIRAGDIVALDPDSGAETTLMQRPGTAPGAPECCFINVSPDGRRVIVADTTQLIVSEIDGTDRRVLLSNEQMSGPPDWSPTGDQIAGTPVSNGASHVELIHPDSGERRQLFESQGFEFHPSWSPDGKWIAFGGKATIDTDSYALYLASRDGSTVRTLVDGLPEGGNCEANAGAWCPELARFSPPSWSPDGRYLAFGSKGQQCCEMRLYVAAVDGGSPPRELDAGNEAMQPSWSPDGTHIAFVRWIAGEGGNGRADLYVMRPDGAGLLPLADDVDPADLAWAPDGTAIAFARGHTGGWGAKGESFAGGLWVVNVDGSGLRQLSDKPVTFGLAWQAILR